MGQCEEEINDALRREAAEKAVARRLSSLSTTSLLKAIDANDEEGGKDFI